MINPDDFPLVEEAFCSISKRQVQDVAELNELVSILNSEMKQLSLHGAPESASEADKQRAYEQIRSLREEKKAIQVQISRINLGKKADSPRSEEVLRDEFQRICALPQVTDARVDNEGEVSFVLHATYVLGGVRYFLNDWIVRFGNYARPVPFQVVLARKGANPDWEYSDPNYTLDTPHKDFCLGDNKQIVTKHFEDHRFLLGMQFVAFLVCSINEGQEWLVPQAFNPEVGIGGVQWPLLTIGTTLSM